MPRTSHDSQTAFETSDDLSAQLRTAEERIRELEAKVRLLEDKADRAERWVYKIWVEIEQKNSSAETRFVSRNHPIPKQSGHRSFELAHCSRLTIWRVLSWRSA